MVTGKTEPTEDLYHSLCTFLTLRAPALHSYENRPTRMRLQSHIDKLISLPQLTIVFHRITKENLDFSHKKSRVHYNSPLIMCCPLFTSTSKFIYL